MYIFKDFVLLLWFWFFERLILRNEAKYLNLRLAMSLRCLRTYQTFPAQQCGWSCMVDWFNWLIRHISYFSRIYNYITLVYLGNLGTLFIYGIHLLNTNLLYSYSKLIQNILYILLIFQDLYCQYDIYFQLS